MTTDGILHQLQYSIGIKALSVRQPFANNILFDGKPVENREWATEFRGWCLLHAGLQPYEGGAAEKRRLQGLGLQFGGIVGAIRIDDCVTRHHSHWFFGTYGFVIGEARPLAFLPCRGALSFFEPDIDRRQLAWETAR